MDYIEIAKAALNPSGYLMELAFKKSMDAFSTSASKKDITSQELSEEAIKANIKSTVLTEQAKVEQEISIAKRILIAEEVEIEEYYDVSGSGGVGAKADGRAITLGLQAEGKKVTKRVIKFKGFNSEAIKLLTVTADKTDPSD